MLLSVALTFTHYAGSGDNAAYSLTHGFFIVASLITTTGFATINYEEWGTLPVAIMLIAMLLGGNAGSTAGGMKISYNFV